MLVTQIGNCSKCESAFGTSETIQSTHVECDNCKKKVIVCKTCKNKGCDCGGKLLDAWDKKPGIMF